MEDNQLMDILPIPLEPNPRKRWFDEISKGKESIVVTAGDSWTWGDSLGPSLGADREYRMNHVYGSIIANKLNSDFLNISKPAGSNISIQDNLIYAMPYLIEKYSKIYVVICMTEIGREMIKDNIWVPDKFDHYIDVDNFLKDYENKMLQSFKNELIDVYPIVKFVVSRNFTYTYNENIQKDHVDKTWMDVLEEILPQENKYPKDLRVLSSMSYTPIIATLKNKGVYNKLKYTMMEQMASSQLAEIWMRNNPMQSDQGTRHPLEKGHVAWAEYLMQYIE
tara:strand:+ start:4688 stop:5524 length:837 start_codon:yes stop_codon:yes gene_type:complete